MNWQKLGEKETGCNGEVVPFLVESVLVSRQKVVGFRVFVVCIFVLYKVQPLTEWRDFCVSVHECFCHCRLYLRIKGVQDSVLL